MAALVEVRLSPARRAPPTVVSAPQPRAVLAQAYAAARTEPRDPRHRVALAQALVDAGQTPRCFRHLRRAMALAPPDWGGLSDVGDLLFRLGEHTAAMQVFAQAEARGCLSSRACRTYAALLHKAGKVLPAKRLLALSALTRPLQAPPTQHPDRPQVLRLRCYDNSRYQTHRNRRTGQWTRSLKSGHFSLFDLLPPGAVDLHVLSAWGDSLSVVDALPEVGALINTIACADLNTPQLRNASRFLERFPDLEVINPPSRVLHSTRQSNSRRLSHITGVRFPRTEAFVLRTDVEDSLSALDALGLAYPLILRVAGSQTGLTMQRIDDRDAARVYLDAHPPGTTLHAIEFIDQPDAEGLYRKTRCFFIDGTFYPVANLVSDTWQIHSGDRYRVMDTNRDAQAREQAYLSDPAGYLGADAMRALQEVATVLGLDFMGIDFTLQDDGSILIFEANAAMRHNYDHANAFPYTRPHLDAIGTAFARMVRQRAGWFG